MTQTNSSPPVRMIGSCGRSWREFVRQHLFEDDPDPVVVGPARRSVLGAGKPAPWDPDTT